MNSNNSIFVYLFILSVLNTCSAFAGWVENPDFFNRSDLTQNNNGYVFALGDMDHDGFADLITSGEDGCRFFKNRGDGSNIKFDLMEAWGQSLKDIVMYWGFQPILTDLNNDGYSDLIYYKDYNTFTCWLNTGKSDVIDFVQADSLINGIQLAGFELKSIADLDHDGDQDVLATQSGIYYVLRNTGTRLDPVWERDTNPITIIGNESCMTLSAMFVDWDHDDEYELAVSLGWPEASGYMAIAENTGSSDNMVYDFSKNRLYLHTYWGFNYTFGDVTGDDKVELMSPDHFWGLTCWNINTLTDDPFIKLKSWQRIAGNRETAFEIKSISKHGDCELQILSMSSFSDYWSGYLSLEKFSISDSNVTLTRMGTVAGTGRLLYPSIQTVDLGQDGSFLLMSAKLMQGEYWEAVPVGSEVIVQTIEPNPYDYPFYDLFQQFYGDSVYYDPKMVDINHDGTLDLLMQESGLYMFWENTGTLYEPHWEKRPEWLSGLAEHYYYQCAIVDMNNDGLEDIVFSESSAPMTLFLNTGTNSLPHWTYDAGVFEDLPVYECITHNFYDVDDDGDQDLIFSDEAGELYCYLNDGVNVGIDQVIMQPHQFVLEQNYPNPFNPETTIRYKLTEQAWVEISIFDITGRKINTLVNEHQAAGAYSVRFDSSDLASGVYIYTIEAGDYRESKKMVVVR